MDTETNTKPTAQQIRWLIILLTPLPGMGIDIYTPSLPSIQLFFHTTTSISQLTISLYLIGIGLGQLILGPISDNVGQKQVLLMGILLFIVTTVMCSLSTSIVELNTLRWIQGFTIAAVPVILKAIITSHFKNVKLRKASAILSASWAVGPIIAPLIGGLVQHYLNWQTNFWILASYATVTAVMVSAFPDQNPRKDQAKKAKSYCSTIKKILTHRLLLFSVISLGLSYSFMVAFHCTAPYTMQLQMKMDPSFYGIASLIIGFFYLLGNLYNIKQTHKHPQIKLIEQSWKIQTIGVILMIAAHLYSQNDIVFYIIPIVIVMTGSAITYANLTAIALSLFPSHPGTTSAIIGAFSMLVSATIGLCISVTNSTGSDFIAVIFSLLLIAGLLLHLGCIKKLLPNQSE